MSKVLGKEISICDRNFHDYNDLAKHMRFLVSEYVKGTGAIDTKHLIKALKAFKESLIFGKHKGVYEYLLRENFQNVCVDLMKLLMKSGDVKLLSKHLSCLITMTDNSKEMCAVLTKNGLSELLVNKTIQVCNNDFSQKLPKSITVESLFDQLILVIDNIVSDPRFQQSFLNCKNLAQFKEKIIPFMESKDHRTRILTMAALTWLIDEDEDRSRLDFFSNIIDIYVDYIKKGMSDKNRRCEGLRISELLAVLQSLANIQTIKNAMLKMKNLMSLLQTILKSDKSACEEIEVTLGILYNLSFKNIFGKDDDIKLKDVCDVESLVMPLVKSSEDQVKSIADCLIDELSEKMNTKSKEIKYDVYISYSNADKEITSKVANTLEKKGLKVFSIKEYIKGSVEKQDAKEKIAQSKIVLLGVSNSFFFNKFCRGESQYAKKLQKYIVPILVQPRYKPKDWLREIIENETSIDFSDDSEFDSLIENLLNCMAKKIKVNNTGVARLPPEVPLVKPRRILNETKDVKQWSKEDVACWLQNNGMGHLKKNLSEYDGKMIEYIRKMKVSSPEQYSRRLKEDLNLSLKDEIDFDGAIEALNYKFIE